MAIQKRNSEMVQLLTPDFISRNDSAIAWVNLSKMLETLPGAIGFWSMGAVAKETIQHIGQTSSYDLANERLGVATIAPDRSVQVVGTIHSSGSDAPFTTSNWLRHIELENGGCIEWKNGGAGSYRAIGSTNNGILYVFRSTSGDASQPATYDFYIDASGEAAFTGPLVPLARLGTAWTGLAYTNAGGTTWADYDPANWTAGRYKKIGDMVFLEGLVKRTAGAGNVIANLPLGFRPVKAILFDTISDAGFSRVDISSGGDISLVAGGTAWFSLSVPPFSVL